MLAEDKELLRRFVDFEIHPDEYTPEDLKALAKFICNEKNLKIKELEDRLTLQKNRTHNIDRVLAVHKAIFDEFYEYLEHNGDINTLDNRLCSSNIFECPKCKINLAYSFVKEGVINGN